MAQEAGSGSDKSRKQSSDKENVKPSASSQQASTASDAVIEGEFEEAADTKKASDASNSDSFSRGSSSKTSAKKDSIVKPSGLGFKAKAGWYTSAALTVFVAGLYASPWVEEGLYRWFPNMMPETSQVDLARGNVDTNVRSALNDINADMRDLKNRVQLMAQGMDTLDEESMSMISALAARVDALESISLNAGQGEADGPSSSALSGDAATRLRNLENQLAAIEGQLDQLSPSIGSSNREGGGVAGGEANGEMSEGVSGVADRALVSNLEQRLSQMSQQLSALEAQVQTIEAQPPMSSNQGPSNIAGDGVNAGANNVGGMASGVVTESELSAVLSRLSVLEQQQNSLLAAQQLGDNATYFAITAARVQQAVFAGQAFTSELNVIKALMLEQSAFNRVQVEQSLTSLAPFSAGGLVQRQALLASFAKAMDNALKAQDTPDNAGWWQQTKNSLASLVQVRRTDMVEGGDRDAVLNRAEAAIEQGDIEAALKELAALSSGPAAAFEGWIGDASNHITAMRASEALLTFAMNQTTAGDSSNGERPNP